MDGALVTNSYMGIGEVMNFCEAPILSSLKAPPKKKLQNYSHVKARSRGWRSLVDPQGCQYLDPMSPAPWTRQKKDNNMAA